MHFRFARAGQMFFFSLNFEGMLEHGFRVRATRRRGKAKALNAKEAGSQILAVHRAKRFAFRTGDREAVFASAVSVAFCRQAELPYL